MMINRRSLLGALGTGAAAVTLLGVGAPLAEARPTLTGCPSLSYGAKGRAVKVLQRVLISHGASVAVDSEFGPATRSAVTSFQRRSSLSVDGVVGPQTWGALVPMVRYGARGAGVKALQGVLNDRGFSLAVDSEFGPATRSAVQKAQRTGGLEPDGSAGPATWRYLISGTPAKAPGLGASVLVTQYTGAAEDDGNCGPACVVALQLALGHKPHGWSHPVKDSVAAVRDRAAVTHAREHVLGLPMRSTAGTGGVSTREAARRVNAGTAINTAKAGDLADALATLWRGGVAMLTGGLTEAARWNGRQAGQVSHWVALLDYRSGKYLACDPSSRYNRLVWVSESEVTRFARAKNSHGALGNTSVCIG